MEKSIKELLESNNLEDVELALCILKSPTKEISDYYWSDEFNHPNSVFMHSKIDIFQKHLTWRTDNSDFFVKNSEATWI